MSQSALHSKPLDIGHWSLHKNNSAETYFHLKNVNDSQGRNVFPIIKGGRTLRGMKPGGKEEEEGKRKKKRRCVGKQRTREIFYFCVCYIGPRLAAGLSNTSPCGSFGCVGRTRQLMRSREEERLRNRA